MIALDCVIRPTATEGEVNVMALCDYLRVGFKPKVEGKPLDWYTFDTTTGIWTNCHTRTLFDYYKLDYIQPVIRFDRDAYRRHIISKSEPLAVINGETIGRKPTDAELDKWAEVEATNRMKPHYLAHLNKVQAFITSLADPRVSGDDVWKGLKAEFKSFDVWNLDIRQSKKSQPRGYEFTYHDAYIGLESLALKLDELAD
jgi:hypothetical protein